MPLDTSTTQTTSSADPLSSLLEVRLGKADGTYTAFPATEFSERGSQDLSVHKYPNLDVARVEPTGRNPSEFTIRGMFTNNIYPGPNESWIAGTLFGGSNSAFGRVLQLLYDASSVPDGQALVLQHPYLGNKNVQVVNWSYEFVGKGPRDGAYINIELIECLVDTSSTQPVALPALVALQQATDGLNNPPLQPPNLNLSQFITQINGAVSRIVSYPNQVVDGITGQFLNIANQVQGIGGQLLTAPQQFNADSQDNYNQAKGAIVNGATVNVYNQMYGGSFGVGLNADIPTPNVNLSGSLFPIVDPFNAIQNVYSAVYALTSTSSATAQQFLQKVENFTKAMIAYYESLNNSQVAQTIVNLYTYLGGIQQVQRNLYNQANLPRVATFVTTTYISLSSLSSRLNTSVDDLLTLNQFLSKSYGVRPNVSVQYYA